MPHELIWPALVLLGIAVGAYGTMIGAGGGFVLVPVLIILYPELSPEAITSISLAVVVLNAMSGSVAYARQRRIDYKAGAIFAVATVPGAAFGAVATGLIDPQAFEIAFALVLLGVAVWLVVPREPRVLVTRPPARYLRRMLTDSHGDTYVYSFDPWFGAAAGLGIGVVASLFGVGGGIFYVPLMVLIMRFPAHIAIATSTFVLLFTAGTGALVHLVLGDFAGVTWEHAALGAGMLVGAQLGAMLSLRLAHHQEVISRLFSVALIAVALRILLGAVL
jgi:uncharacterized membrane protein YfcA